MELFWIGDDSPRVVKCQIFYTEQIFQTKFYPKKSAQIATNLVPRGNKKTQKLNILSWNPGLKTELHICCLNLPKTILDLAKLFILPDFLPQPSNFFLHGYICDILQLWERWWWGWCFVTINWWKKPTASQAATWAGRNKQWAKQKYCWAVQWNTNTLQMKTQIQIQ